MQGRAYDTLLTARVLHSQRDSQRDDVTIFLSDAFSPRLPMYSVCRDGKGVCTQYVCMFPPLCFSKDCLFACLVQAFSPDIRPRFSPGQHYVL